MRLADFYRQPAHGYQRQAAAYFLVAPFFARWCFHRQPVSPETEMADVLDTDNYHGLRAGRDFPGLAR